MNEKDIQSLFEGIADGQVKENRAVQQVFSVLVKTTLKYRDKVLSLHGVVVTVEDVRTCLDWLMPALATGNRPKTDNKLRLGLLDLWLEEFGKGDL